jgi:transaldolase
MACADAGRTLISLFLDRALNWYESDNPEALTNETHPGAASVSRIPYPISHIPYPISHIPYHISTILINTGTVKPKLYPQASGMVVKW